MLAGLLRSFLTVSAVLNCELILHGVHPDAVPRVSAHVDRDGAPAGPLDELAVRLRRLSSLGLRGLAPLYPAVVYYLPVLVPQLFYDLILGGRDLEE